MDYDVDLINRFQKTANRANIIEALSRVSEKYPGIYNTFQDNKYFSTVVGEYEYVKNYFNHVFQALGLPQAKLLEFLDIRDREKRYNLFPGAKKVLMELGQNGYELGIISNGRPSRRSVLVSHGVLAMFASDLIIISDEVGLYKPDPEIFSLAISKCSFPSSKIYLVDDEIQNISAAEHVGITGILTSNKNADREAGAINIIDLPTFLQKNQPSRHK